MGMLITQNQSTFVEKRQIQDNILVANEVFRHFKIKKKGRIYVLALKVDMNKAYDKVEWNLLEGIMVKIGFEKNGLGGKWSAFLLYPAI